MSNSPSWPAHLSPQSQKPSTSWTLPALKITNFWENTKRRNLTKWSSKSRMLGLLWQSVNGVSLRIIGWVTPSNVLPLFDTTQHKAICRLPCVQLLRTQLAPKNIVIRLYQITFCFWDFFKDLFEVV